MKLFVDAVTKLFLGLLCIGLLLFLPAGTLFYPAAWCLLGLLFVPMVLAGIVMFIKAPDLLRKRLDVREKRGAQKGIVALTACLFAASFLVCGFDFRYGLSPLPLWVQIAAAAVFLLAYGLYGEVLRENAYLSRTVTVEDGQKVVDTGCYAIIRHPMYLATILLFLSMPLVLGSLYGLLVLLFYVPLIVCRIRDEERLLTKMLSGYAAYKEKVKWRLFPFVW